ncbi:general substrate transporter [Ilyonectria destructans]|nr:general substrate transporter [Ilyonectria destructans]
MLLASIFSLCLTGFDASLIGNLNVVPKYYEHFKLTTDLVALNTAIVSAGQVVSGLFAGHLSDHFGRRGALSIGASIIIIGAVLQASATTEAQFCVGRFVEGFAFTIVQTSSTTWIMESMPPKHRGILMGILISSIPLSGVLSSGINIGTFNLDSNWAWRSGFMVEIAFPMISLCLLPFTHESPRWLVYKGRSAEALAVISHLHAHGNADDPEVRREFAEITEVIEKERQIEKPWKNLIEPRSNLKRFSYSALTMIFYQITGSNTLIFFFPLILANAGINSVKTILIVIACLTGCIFFCVITGGWLSDRFGRKKILVTGTIVMDICLVILAVLSYLSASQKSTVYGPGAIVAVLVFQFASYNSWMILNYTYPLEVLSFTQRAKGVAASQSLSYAFSFLTLYTIPIALKHIGWKFYVINASWNIVIIAVVIFYFEETKGKTLEAAGNTIEGQAVDESTSTGEPKGSIKSVTVKGET